MSALPWPGDAIPCERCGQPTLPVQPGTLVPASVAVLCRGCASKFTLHVQVRRKR